METIERWRQPAAEMGLRFVEAPGYIALREPLPGMPSRPTLADVVRSRLPVMRELRPDVVVNDFFYVPSALAAELEGLRRATLVPHPYPGQRAGAAVLPRQPAATADADRRCRVAADAALVREARAKGSTGAQLRAPGPRPAPPAAPLRRHQRGPRDGGHLSPARVPAALALPRPRHRADAVRAPAPGDRAPGRRGAARPGCGQHGTGSGAEAGEDRHPGLRGRAGQGPGVAQPAGQDLARPGAGERHRGRLGVLQPGPAATHPRSSATVGTGPWSGRSARVFPWWSARLAGTWARTGLAWPGAAPA